MSDDELLPGLYELLVTREVQDRLAADGVMPPDEVGIRSPEVLGRYVGKAVEHVLRADSKASSEDQAALVNRVMAVLRETAPAAFAPGAGDVVAPVRELIEVSGDVLPTGEYVRLERPALPLSDAGLFVNGRGEPAVGNELNREIASADRVDVLIPFVRWTGVRIFKGALRQVIQRGGEVRVIASTYLGSTEAKALDALVELGAKVKVSYDTSSTRMHAKAWLFERASGFSTAFIGSSNLSQTAMLDGLEWNVRLAEVDTPAVFETFRVTFDSYWNDPQNDDYDAEQFALAMQAERRADNTTDVSPLDVTARPFQKRILEALEVERHRHDRHRNLVVSATGTGKTVMAALDYQRLRKQAGRDYSLLFVAHRKEILDQARRTFRNVLKDGAFGELYVGGERPTQWQHVFASVQGLATLDLSSIDPRRFDMVIIDEFHHSAAPTYKRLLEHFDPEELLGLTATPERSDGEDRAILDQYFEGRFAAELRLWDAIDDGTLCPFQYFGVHDDVDLTGLRWTRGHYDLSDLENVYTGNDMRLAKVLKALRDIVADPLSMKALGFCVSIAHAEYMAKKFNEAGIPSVAVSASTAPDERKGALNDLAVGRVNCLFAVDLFNEGLDLPDIDTVLFLRPTESATVFLQQLGRGLRRTDTKACLTVLDFIGNQNQKFRFDRRLRALLPATGITDLKRQVSEDFPLLPAGCFMTLDRVAQSIVLKNLETAIRGGWKEMVTELKDLGDVTLDAFLRETQREPWELYRSSVRGSGTRKGWVALRRDAGLAAPVAQDGDELAIRAIGRMLHIGDAERLRYYLDLLKAGAPPAIPADDEREHRLLTMLHFDIWGSRKDLTTLAAGLAEIWERPAVREELIAVLAALDLRADAETHALDWAPDVPLSVHARYSRDEVLAAIGRSTAKAPATFREGVLWDKAHDADLFFVTLEKDEKVFSESTRYKDVALSPTLFQWESQSQTSQASPTGQRYINQQAGGNRMLLFVRRLAGDPFVLAGPAAYVSHEGDRPIRFRWRLQYPLPELVFEQSRAVA